MKILLYFHVFLGSIFKSIYYFLDLAPLPPLALFAFTSLFLLLLNHSI